MDKIHMDGSLFAQWMCGASSCLGANQALVNDLNVFPVPDGDTGDNMRLTVHGGVRNLQKEPSRAIGEAAARFSSGTLMSARGNSGVILSQFFAGIAHGLDGLSTATAEDLAHALEEGVRRAYASTAKPVEGTLLTVMREGTEAVVRAASAQQSLGDFLSVWVSAVSASLDRTPELLPVLKEAGVVDSGGAGLFYLCKGMLMAHKGEEIPESVMPLPSAAAKDVDFSLFDADSVMKYGYCTEFLLRLQTAKTDVMAFDTDALIAKLSEVGNSIVAVKDGTVVKVHVHTMTPGAVLDYCQGFGEFLTVKIENMTLQHHEQTAKSEVDAKKKKKPLAVIAVANGDGIRDVFSQLGVDYLINGGQGHNPSTDDFTHAFDEVCAEEIVVLPNNGNIVMTAKQAASLYRGSRIYVLECKNMGAGISACSVLPPSGDGMETAEEMQEIIDGVVTGMVTVSVRDVCLNGVDIHRGHYIGFCDKTMHLSEKNKVDAAMGLLEHLQAPSYDFLTVIYGKDTSPADRMEFSRRVAETYADMEYCEMDGGQEVYDFLLVLQ